MRDTEQRLAAKQFAQDWAGRGDEKQETQSFWLSLLQKVFGIAEPEKEISFEVPVKLDHTSFIDGYIASTRVLIEQKGQEIDLKKGYKQSDGAVLTPFQQARRYAGSLPHNQNPRWIVVSNFREFHIHDMNRPNDTAEIVTLESLEKEFHRLNFLVDTGDENIKEEMRISLEAGELVSALYDALLGQYQDPESEETLKHLNKLCVRLVFCLYAEDAGIFGAHGKFYHYLNIHRDHARNALIDLFRVLNTPEKNRDPYMDDDLKAFPYVNGGLFADEAVVIPRLDDQIVDLILNRASADFDWSEISPTIFGAVFESTLNPETRRSGGMHYTSIENIHKVIDPLFLTELTEELDEIKEIGVDKTRIARLQAYQQKLASLTFLDPACGSGNFLTETYLSLRRLENKVLALLIAAQKKQVEGQIILGDEGASNPIQVSINQFYGIEINDFAVTVAKTALWIAESQMMKETEDVVHMNLEFLPLKTNAHIVEGNALRIDWESIVPKDKLNYIMGNPPFVGMKYQTKQQKEDMSIVFGKTKNYGSLDFVASWYYKATQYIHSTHIAVSFVSTNSISQGEQASILWKPLLEMGISINFAHRTFRWDSEVNNYAAVHCVIIGFSMNNDPRKYIFSLGRKTQVNNINPYLLDAPNTVVTTRTTPLSNVPKIIAGNKPVDGDFLKIEEEDYLPFIEKEPKAKQYIKKLIGGYEFINRKRRYVLWLVGVPPAEIKSMPLVYDRVKKVREARLNMKDEGAIKLADKPTTFRDTLNPEHYIVIPIVSSENRKYVPMGFLGKDTIPTNQVQIIPDASIYHFGILTSNVHMAWMRAVCGRLEMRYRYTGKIVYNNFPWPNPTEEQKAKIEQTAQGILDARALYPDCSLADLYDEVTMPPELRKAHQQNDRAVMQAYGFDLKTTTEESCVAELMKLYQELTK